MDLRQFRDWALAEASTAARMAREHDALGNGLVAHDNKELEKALRLVAGHIDYTLTVSKPATA